MRGKSPTAGLEQRNCATCGKLFQPYRQNCVTCSRECYGKQPAVREKNNAARRTPEARERKNKWRRTDPHQKERMRTYNRQFQLARYGLTVEEYDVMLAAQDGLCMVCGQAAKPDGIRAASRLHVDHDHETGQVRGLLCLNCNRGIGYFGDDPELLRAAADFIEGHQSPGRPPTAARAARLS